MRIQVITGTTRQGRFSERVTDWVLRHLGERPEFELELVDLRDHPLPFFDGHGAGADRSRLPDATTSPGSGRRIDRADGFVVLTAEYNHGYPAVLKNAMDWTFVEWRRKPITFVGWGNVGGARAIEQLRDGGGRVRDGAAAPRGPHPPRRDDPGDARGRRRRRLARSRRCNPSSSSWPKTSRGGRGR